MSTKQHHLLKFWHKALISVCKERGTASAGEVAKYVGQSRNTAKKYLDLLVVGQVVATEKTYHNNGIEMTCYFPIREPRP